MFGKLIAVALVSVVAWAGFVRPSDANAPPRAYVVRPGDSLWSIAARNYAGDPREGVWKLRRANSLAAAPIRPGQLLQLP